VTLNVTAGTVGDPKANAIVEAAGFRNIGLAPAMIASLFGEDMANGQGGALTLPLPTEIEGATVWIRDSGGTVHQCELFFVSPLQINFFVPPAVAFGEGAAWVERDGVKSAELIITVNSVAPGLFAANANGQGPPAGAAISVQGEQQTSRPYFDCGDGGCVTKAIPFDPGGERLVLVIFGTGFRGHAGTLEATLDDIPLAIEYAGDQGFFIGLDQLNLVAPGSLDGYGKGMLRFTVNGVPANELEVWID
jgi:uncharacterized protein (TIGR03437 family)